MATLYTAFFPGLMMDVLGCPEMLAEQAVRNSAIEFCRRSLAWRTNLAPIAVTANIGEYALTSPAAETRVAKIYEVILSTPSPDPAVAQPDIRVLEPRTVQYLDSITPTWRQSQAQLLANSYSSVIPTKFYTQDVPDKILLAGVPVMAGTLNVLASVVPTLVSTGVDAWIAEQYHEGILHGAKARLMAIPGKPWSNPAMSGWHQTEFDKAIAGANAEAAQSFQSDAPIRVTGYSK